MTVEKMLEIGELFDLYGPLLTERQRQLVDLHYRQDLSLGEIAEGEGVSRQAIHDQVRRAEEALREYEARLALGARERRQRALVERVLELLRPAAAGDARVKGAIALLEDWREGVDGT